MTAAVYATPSASTSTTPKTAAKAKPVNVFTDDGSFLERFQRSKQEDDDRRKAEEALTTKKHFSDRFKNRGKRPPPPDSSAAVTNTDVDLNPAKKAKLGDASSNRVKDPRTRSLIDK